MSEKNLTKDIEIVNGAVVENDKTSSCHYIVD